MKSVKVAIMIIAIVLLSAGVTVILKHQTQTVNSWSLPYNYSVDSKGVVGISVDTGLPVQFGSSGPGATLMRYIDVGNSYARPVNVVIRGTAQNKQWLSYQDPGPIMPNDQQRVEVYIQIPESAEPGDYEGIMQIITIKSGQTPSNED